MDFRLSVLWSVFLYLLQPKQSLGFKFTIIHNNDMHARYEPITDGDAICPKGDDEKGLCFGGFARVATAVARFRAEGPTLYLNAGDTFQGTDWYTFYKGELAAELLNMLSPDAIALGNHELDDNINGLIPFLQKVNFPIVCSNLDMRKEPKLQGLQNLVKSTIITKFNKKIGIIGYITPFTKFFTPDNLLGYYEEIHSINSEARKLRNRGIDIIIALGHSGYQMDKRIALHCPNVDVVVGGHSHSFLYTGTPPVKDTPHGNYPTVVTKPNGQRVPVVQAYAFTKYMGKIDLEFDDKGHLTNFNGTPILLDKSIPQQAEVKALLATKKQAMEADAENRALMLRKLLITDDEDLNTLTNSTGHAANRDDFLAWILILFPLVIKFQYSPMF